MRIASGSLPKSRDQPGRCGCVRIQLQQSVRRSRACRRHGVREMREQQRARCRRRLVDHRVQRGHVHQVGGGSVGNGAMPAHCVEIEARDAHDVRRESNGAGVVLARGLDDLLQLRHEVGELRVPATRASPPSRRRNATRWRLTAASSCCGVPCGSFSRSRNDCAIRVPTAATPRASSDRRRLDVLDATSASRLDSDSPSSISRVMSAT